MISDVLDATGIPWKEGGWYPVAPPKPPFMVLLESVDVGGADLKVFRTKTSTTIELYSESTGDKWQAAVASLEEALVSENISFRRDEPTYIESERWYLTVLEFTRDIYEKL